MSMRAIAVLCTVFGVVLLGAPPAWAGTPEQPKVERKGPLAALPSAPGAHIEKIKALGDNQWLKLEVPAPDPKWGSAHSVSWGGKMAYASDLRGGFIYGEDQHGWYNQKTGYYYDSLWFYDLNANRWICCYPGTHVPTFAQKIKDGELKVDDNGNLVDPDGQPLPVAPLIHPYGMVTYDPDAHKLAVGSSWGRHHHSAGTLKDVYAAWDEQLKSKNIKGQVMSPWFYDTVKGKWEIYPAKGNHGGIFGGFEYIPSKKEYFECSYSRQADAHFFDPRTQAWRRSPAAGGPGGIDASACHDTKRDRVYYGGSEYGGNNPADNFFSYDLKTDVWKKLNVSADRWKANMSSFNALFHYDSAGDRLVSILTPANPKDGQKVYTYDPETDRCEEPRPLPPEVLKDTEGCLASGFYDPELNVHFCLYSNGCNTPYRSLWVYRYKRAPEKK